MEQFLADKSMINSTLFFVYFYERRKLGTQNASQLRIFQVFFDRELRIFSFKFDAILNFSFYQRTFNSILFFIYF